MIVSDNPTLDPLPDGAPVPPGSSNIGFADAPLTARRPSWVFHKEHKEGRNNGGAH
jgi:hypothetical protein